jgi:hypothetical protein
MGLKRKASDSLSPYSPSSSSSSPFPTTPSGRNVKLPQPFQSHSASIHTPLSGWGSPEPYFASGILNSSPYTSTTITTTTTAHYDQLNSRTRKRFRDNRPNEEAIHQTTLAKLYAAQRHEQKPESEDHGILLNPSPTLASATLKRTESQASTTNTAQQKEKGQVSLHTFFGGGQSRPTPVPGQDPQSSSSTPLPTTFARCEDCSTPLLTSSSNNNPYHQSGDTEMMDVDADFTISSEGDASTFSCTNCSKRVCDVCAVRGDRRVCLECANSGNGPGQGYGSGLMMMGGMGGSCGVEAGAGGVYGYGGRGGGGMEMGEKRWVGGIGWM